MKKLDLKALLYTALSLVVLLGVAFLGFCFPLPMLFSVSIAMFGFFAYNMYKAFSLTNEINKNKNK